MAKATFEIECKDPALLDWFEKWLTHIGPHRFEGEAVEQQWYDFEEVDGERRPIFKDDGQPEFITISIERTS